MDKLNQQLIDAAVKGDLTVVKSALDEGADIEALDTKYCYTPLILAAWNGHTETVKYLLDRGANIEAKDTGEQTSLMKAAYYGRTESVRLLLERGADVDAKDYIFKTALMIAEKENEADVVGLISGFIKSRNDQKSLSSLIDTESLGQHIVSF